MTKKSKVEEIPELSIQEQCDVLGLNRSSFYYRSNPRKHDDKLVKSIEEIYTNKPFYGHRKVLCQLLGQGFEVGKKLVLNLKNKLGLKTAFPKKRLSIPADNYVRYPYLLKDMSISAPNQVWASDITYLPCKQGNLYMVTIIDWYSRKVLANLISNTMDRRFCLEALEEAICKYGKPEVFNTDLGSQFTSHDFIEKLTEHGIKVSHDGKGKWADNIIIERFFRTMKYEEYFLKYYDSVKEAKRSIAKYIDFYNGQRFHAALIYKTPNQVYQQYFEDLYKMMAN
jgi:putative transposase